MLATSMGKDGPINAGEGSVPFRWAVEAIADGDTVRAAAVGIPDMPCRPDVRQDASTTLTAYGEHKSTGLQDIPTGPKVCAGFGCARKEGGGAVMDSPVLRGMRLDKA